MVKVNDYDFSKHLKTEKDIQLYLETAFEDGDPGFVAYALGNVAKVRGMSNVAKDSGLNRENLYRALSKKSTPSYKVISGVMQSLGYGLAPVKLKKAG
ncbi:MAG: putative addiction module antidote protein [Candidatus Margulisbacteria bacterium]|jgi:probable addiction module antidote protein|nr:putative addiction module antidote protein [Candidatus Margulisiibacteriota bacterium]